MVENTPIDEMNLKLTAMSLFTCRNSDKNVILNNLNITMKLERALVTPATTSNVPAQKVCVDLLKHSPYFSVFILFFK